MARGTSADIQKFQESLKSTKNILKLEVERPVYDEVELRQVFHYKKPKLSVIQTISKPLKNATCKSCIESIFPITCWLRKYKWKTDFIHDVISGVTVAVMHIPQGMAYALLGSVSPVVGIYMAIFPVLIYVFLGTSKHVSMGTFAIVCLMTGRAVTSLATPLSDIDKANRTHIISDFLPPDKNYYSPEQVATTVTFAVGIIQFLMYACRLGIVSSLLSETFVNGFTTGAAVHVLMSQIFDFLGLNSDKPRGNFKFLKTIIVIFNDIPNVNMAAVIISITTSFIMIINNEFLKPWVNRRCSFPIPIELIAVIAGTLSSRYFVLPNKYGIKTVGHIPVGIPQPKMPALELVPAVILDSIAITMVSYTVTMSMSLIFAKKLHYEVDPNQELLAMGSGNIVGSFLSCMPVSASLSRSLIQQTVGGKSQLASVISCSLLTIILLWIAPFFEQLPRCILASIIIVALKGMFVQAKELVRFWKLNKIDAFVWIITFSSTVLINIDIGLLTGLLSSLVSILLQSVKHYSCLLGHVPNTDLYLDMSRFNGVTEIFGIKIYHYCGTLNFINSGRLASDIQEKVEVNPREVLEQQEKLNHKNTYSEESDFENKFNLRCIVMDMSAITYMDPSGVEVLRDVVTDFARINVPVYIASCSVSVFDRIKKCDLLQKGKLTFLIFATIHDAVHFARKELLSKTL